jgi:hypothetical protein
MMPREQTKTQYASGPDRIAIRWSIAVPLIIIIFVISASPVIFDLLH